MTRQPRQTIAGMIMVLSLTVGVIAGIVAHQPSLGFIAGLGIGAVLAGIAAAIEARK